MESEHTSNLFSKEFSRNQIVSFCSGISVCHRLCSGKRPYFEIAIPRRLSNTEPFRVWRCLFVGRPRNPQLLRSRGAKTPFQRKATSTTATKRPPCSLFTSTAPSGSRHPFPKFSPLTPAQPHAFPHLSWASHSSPAQPTPTEPSGESPSEPLSSRPAEDRRQQPGSGIAGNRCNRRAAAAAAAMVPFVVELF